MDWKTGGKRQNAIADVWIVTFRTVKVKYALSAKFESDKMHDWMKCWDWLMNIIWISTFASWKIAHFDLKSLV